jgi:outer membrane lipoprotein SlyB
MSMRPLQAQNPFGQFDGLDSEVTTLLGGEVVGFTAVTVSGTDKHAADVSDGYSGTTTPKRPAVTKTLVSGMRPLFLADEGVKGYGTLFGELVGGTIGQVVSGGTQLGPHTAAGSGKVTLWGNSGMYAVSLDAVDTTVSTGLVPGNSSLLPGTALYATTAGKLTPAIGSAFEAVVVARFIEFQTAYGRVNTTLDMVSALNSPSAGVHGPTGGTFDHVVIHFGGGLES